MLYLLAAVVYTVHVGDEVDQLVGVAPFIVVPGDQFHEMIVQHDAGGFIEDTGFKEAGQVGGNDLVSGAGDDPLHIGAGCFTHGIADIIKGIVNDYLTDTK